MQWLVNAVDSRTQEGVLQAEEGIALSSSHDVQ